jgi:MFS family permease
MYANMLVTTQILQQPTVTGYGLGYDIFHTGLWLAPTAVVFGAMAPIAAATIRLLGPQVTLLAGAFGMGVSYVVRIFLSHDLWQIELGSVLVGVGTSLTFAAMPNLIMRAVPDSETASANGLNTVLRSVGTSTSSAALAAIATAAVIRIGDHAYPSFSAFTTVFWMAGAAAFVAGLLVLPLLRMREGSDTTAQDIVIPERVVHGEPLHVQTG